MHYPIQTASATEQPDRELIELNRKIDELLTNRDRMFEIEREIITRNSSKLLPDDAKLNEKILHFLEKINQPVTEFIIANSDEISQDVDIIYVILCYLQSIGKVKQTKELKWEIVK